MPGVKALTLIVAGNEYLASLELGRVRAHWKHMNEIAPPTSPISANLL